MKKRIIAILLLLYLLTACQPTPEEEAVTNRADGSLEQAIVSTPIPAYRYEAPERIDEMCYYREQEVRFSANVEVPTVEQFPVTTIKRHELSKSDVIAYLQAFRTGEWKIRENEYSRAELMKDLENAAKGELAGSDDNQSWRSNEEEMQRIQKLIEEAPLEDTFVPLAPDRLTFPIKTIPVVDSTDTVWYLFAKDGQFARFSLRRHRDGNVQKELVVLEGEATPGEAPHALENIRISEEDAVAQGDAVIETLGLKDFHVADVQKAREVQSYTYAEYGEGYLLTYVYALPGTIPCFYGGYSDPSFLTFTQDDGLTYAPQWRQECVQIFITEDGVQFLSMAYPKDIVMVANENVQLLPFDKVVARLKKLLEYGTANGGDGSPILIERIVLTTTIARTLDQVDEAFYVPTWVIFLNTEQNKEVNMDINCLLINAIDGTVISRQ